MRSTRLLWVLPGLLAAAACGDDAGALDGYDDTFVGGKADGLGVEEGSPEACRVLRAANESTRTQLDDDAGIDSRAVAGIVTARPFDTLAELDAVPYVGPKVAARLLEYAEAHGLTCDGTPPPADECVAAGGTYDGVAFTEREECHAVEFMRFARLSEMDGIGDSARGVIHDQCAVALRPCQPDRAARWRTVAEFAEYPRIGTTSVRQLKTAAAAWTRAGLPYDTVADVWARRADLDGHPIGLERVYVTDRRSQQSGAGWNYQCVQVRDAKAAPNYLTTCVRENASDTGTDCTGDASGCLDRAVGRWVSVRGVLHGSTLYASDSGPSEASPDVPAFGEDPACTGSWCTLPPPVGLLGAADHASAWSGRELLVWGGGYAIGQRFSPTEGAWRLMATAGAPSGRASAASAWTGTELFVWGGADLAAAGGAAHADGALYDPAADSWRAVAGAGAPSPRLRPMSVWTGSEALVWGGRDANGLLGTGGAYDPEVDRWRPIPTEGAPSPREHAAAAWTGDEFLVWGGGDLYGDPTLGWRADGAAYDPATDRWRPIAAEGAPSIRYAPAALWTGSELLVVGGALAGRDDALDGAAYDPARDAWRALPSPPATSARWIAAVWTGREAVFFGGDELGLSPGLAYSPATDAWRALPSEYRPGPRTSPSLVFTGADLIVWGGGGGGRSGARIRLP